MKNTKEMEIIAARAQIIRQITEKNNAIAYAEKIIRPAIEEATKQGKREAVFTKVKNINWWFLKDYLEKNDFTICSNLDKYIVRW